MESPASSRRRFLAQSLRGLGSAWLAANWAEILSAQQHAHHATQATTALKFEFFTPEQAAEIEAIAAQIIPADESPGARETGVIYFIDRALATFDREKQDLYRKGLQELERQLVKASPPELPFSRLSSEQQLEILKAMEKSDFFEAVRVHTITGFLASDEYGGNKDQAGWKLIGFEDEHSFEPPFGYYDRPENMGGGSQ